MLKKTIKKQHLDRLSSCLNIFRVCELFVHFCELIFRLCGIFVTLEKFVIPPADILSNLLVVLTDDVNEFVVCSVCLVLVSGEVTVEFTVLIAQNWRVGSVLVERTI